MTTKFLLGANAVLATVLAMTGASPSFAGTAESDMKFATTHVEQAEHQMTRLRVMTTPASRLAVLDRTIELLQLAWSDASGRQTDKFIAVRRRINADLVTSFVTESEIHFKRGSLPLAKGRALDALELDPDDSRALNLIVMIRDAETTDVYDKNQGAAAIDRIRARRAAAGIPLRDRGAARNR
jgi:hypothetical protein